MAMTVLSLVVRSIGMPGRSLAVLALVFGLGLGAPNSGFAQVAGAGTVVAAGGASLANSGSPLTPVATSVLLRAMSTNDGAFMLAALQPGHYTMGAMPTGFWHLERQSVVVSVEEGYPVENLPLKGRSFQSLLELMPGMVLTHGGEGQPEDSRFSVNGQRSDANCPTLDGVSAGAPSGGTCVNGPKPSQVSKFLSLRDFRTFAGLGFLGGVKPFRIQTSTYAPEFGRTRGGRMSLVASSGTNVLLRTASESSRHDYQDAADWFRDRDGLAKPQRKLYDMDVVVAEPTVQSRAFLFWSYGTPGLHQPWTTGATVLIFEFAEWICHRPSFLVALFVRNGLGPKIMSESAAPAACQFNIGNWFRDANAKHEVKVGIDFRQSILWLHVSGAWPQALVQSSSTRGLTVRTPSRMPGERSRSRTTRRRRPKWR